MAKRLTRFRYWRLILALTFACLAFSQALESQHDHQQLQTDCYFCQHAAAIATVDNTPQIETAEVGSWTESAPYFRRNREPQPCGNRDPPKKPTTSA